MVDELDFLGVVRVMNRVLNLNGGGLVRWIFLGVEKVTLMGSLKKKMVPLKYITLIQDMYKGVATNVRTCGGVTDSFPINIGLHQGSALSPLLFAVVLDQLTGHIQEEVPWCMLFCG